MIRKNMKKHGHEWDVCCLRRVTKPIAILAQGTTSDDRTIWLPQMTNLEPSAEFCLPKWSIVQREWNHSFFVAYPQLPPHNIKKKTKSTCGTRKLYVIIKKYVNKWVPSKKSLKRNNYSEISNEKCHSAKNCENKKILTVQQSILPVWLWKPTPSASDVGQSLFQKCSEKRHLKSLPRFQERRFPLLQLLPMCGNLKSTPVSRTFLCAWSTLDEANLIFPHLSQKLLKHKHSRTHMPTMCKM